MNRSEKIKFLNGLLRKDPEALDMLKQLRDQNNSGITSVQVIAAFHLLLEHPAHSPYIGKLQESDLPGIIDVIDKTIRNESLQNCTPESLEQFVDLFRFVEKLRGSDKLNLLNPYLNEYDASA